MTSAPTPLASRLATLDRPEDHPEREQLILQSLGDHSPQVREVAIAWAARVLEPAALIPLVADAGDALLRNAALAALERQGPYAMEAVERAVSAPDTDLAMFACQVLGSIGGGSSGAPLLSALGRSEVNVIQAAAEALGCLRWRQAVPALVGLLEQEPWLQLAAADALGAIGDPQAAKPLLALVPDTMIAEPALEALVRIASPEALPQLLTLLMDPRNARLRGPLLRAAGASLGAEEARAAGGGSHTPASPGRRASHAAYDLTAVGRAIEADHGETSLWQFLAERLGGGEEPPAPPSTHESGDDRSQSRSGSSTLRAAAVLVLAGGITSLLPLLVRWAEERDSRAWVEPLVRRYPERVVSVAGSLLAHPDPAVRAGALWTLPPAAVGADQLRAALEDSIPAVRVAACRGIGVIGDSVAAKRLAALLDSGSAAERAAAAEALTRLPQESQLAFLAPRLAPSTDEAVLLAVLAALAASPCPVLDERVLHLVGAVTGPVRRGAIRAAAMIPGPRAEVLLLRALADRDPGLQVEALDLLVGRGGERVGTTLLAMLGIGDSLRYHVIRALGRLGRAEAVAPLETLFTSAPLHERIEILTALARLGGVAAREFLRQCLDQAQPEIRRVAAQGLAALAEPDDLDLLGQLARDRDWVLRSEAAQALGRLGPGRARPVLLDLVRDLEPAVARTARAALAER